MTDLLKTLIVYQLLAPVGYWGGASPPTVKDIEEVQKIINEILGTTEPLRLKLPPALYWGCADRTGTSSVL